MPPSADRAALKARIAKGVEAAHLRALDLARQGFRAILTRREKDFPALAEQTVLQIPTANGDLEGRLYRPVDVAPDAPLLLFFHGGGFVVSDLDTHEALCIRLAHAAGVRVLSAAYRLAPENRFPAQVDDAAAVTRWVLNDFEGGSARTAGLTLGGDSAGGYLALCAWDAVKDDTPDAVRALLLIYPLLHIDESVWASSMMRETRVLGWAAVRYIRAQLLPVGVTASSWLDRPDLVTPSMVIVSGGVLDPVRADALVFRDRLRANGVTVEWREYPTMIHGFANLTHAVRTAREAVGEVGRLVGEMARKTDLKSA